MLERTQPSPLALPNVSPLLQTHPHLCPKLMPLTPTVCPHLSSCKCMSLALTLHAHAHALHTHTHDANAHLQNPRQHTADAPSMHMCMQDADVLCAQDALHILDAYAH
jgi:hypothetical protein